MNPIFSRSKMLAAFVGLMLFTACSNYGKKVSIAGTKGEVYYKGDGVTEADANSTGKVLQDVGYFANDDKTRSVQIMKNNNRIEARFVVDMKALDTVKEADAIFAGIATTISQKVFNNTPVDVIYTDDQFKGTRTVSFKPAAEVLDNKKEPINENAQQTSYNDNSSNSNSNSQDISDEEKAINAEIAKMHRKDYHENTLYCGDRITEDEATKLAEYLKKVEFFTETSNNDLIVNKLNDKDAYFRFSIKASANNEETMQMVDAFVKKMKEDFFSDESIRFEVLNDRMQHLRTFSY